jgi:hypothetical protein
MPTAVAAKVDLYKEHANEYATPRDPVLIDTKPAKYLTIEGRGKPGGPEFEQGIGALYAMAYTMKMTHKFAGGQDYAVCKLEAQYWAGECGADFGKTPPEQWRWKLMIRTPEFMGTKELRSAAASLAAKGKGADVDRVQLETVREGRCVQVLHVGPYDREPESIERMRTSAAEKKYDFKGPHHEIYLSDPRRAAPEKLRTILRIPVQRHA